MNYLVTGVSSGLGFELAYQLVDCGRVIGVSRTIGKSDAFSQDPRFKFIPWDLSLISTEAGASIFFDKIKGLINDENLTLVINAAQFYSGKTRLSNPDTVQMLNVNLLSIMKLIQFLRQLKLKRIFIVNSISGLIGEATQHEYVASKHALMGFTRSLIKESKNSKYDVMCINPGGINTELWDDYPDVDTDTFIEPKELARIIVSLLMIKQRLFIENMIILPPEDV